MMRVEKYICPDDQKERERERKRERERESVRRDKRNFAEISIIMKS